MSDALFFEFSGVSAHDYKAVNAILGLDPAAGDGLWPAGMLSHTGAAAPDGGFVVFEVWASQESQAAWMASRSEAGPMAVRRRALQRLTADQASPINMASAPHRPCASQNRSTSCIGSSGTATALPRCSDGRPGLRI
jgi:hypothetical protein